MNHIDKQKEYEEKLRRYIKENNIHAEHLSFNQSCHSVADAATAVNAKPEDFVKNICMIDKENNLIVAIVNGKDRASTTKVGKVLGIERPEIASPNQIFEKTGYPCGGTPSFSYRAKFIIDLKVMEMKFVYSGGGSQNSLVKISTKELQKINGGIITKISK
ncbi:YbaK/EbsC family protein [Candidatus Micrarchaeota archaeon]|nr:YbaK/EbsC family protein [Candidatus Micrarchaeota archaeon]MBU1165969.1 YbaK/EbsC family protein [Candidatus Micrarchaeota archaeon]MBU1886873.1 YbaK/EbsC family protein [Candidatus Micrarchaeota archaeon]